MYLLIRRAIISRMKLASRSNRIGVSSDGYDSTARDSPPPRAPPSRQVIMIAYRTK